MATHTGQIKSFGLWKGYGFILSEEVPGEEIFFSKKNLPKEIQDHLGDRSGLQLAGKQVTFQMQNNSGKPQAHQVNLVATDGDEIVGKVKSYNGSKGYGFLESCSVEGQDIFFMKRELNPQVQDVPLVGMPARFTLTFAADGKPQAKKVNPPPGVIPSAPMGFGKGDGKGCKGGFGGFGGFGMFAPPAMMALAGPKGFGKGGFIMVPPMGGPPQHAQGQRDKAMHGTVKSYNDVKGFGFIQSPELPVDIYFKGEGQSYTPGQTLCFYLHMTQDGKPQGRGISPGFAEGETAIGAVKSFNAGKGYGFVEVPNRPGDVYFKRELLPEGFQDDSIVGKQVQLQLVLNPQGKPQAQALEFVEGTAAVKPAGGVKRAGPWNTNQAPKRMREETGAELDGTVKSYNQGKGWGFIRTDSLPSDVYFKGNYPEALPGAACRFQLAYTPDGKPQAQKLEF